MYPSSRVVEGRGEGVLLGLRYGVTVPSLGVDPVGVIKVGVNALGVDAVGMDAVGVIIVGVNTLGVDAVVVTTAGEETHTHTPHSGVGVVV